MNTEPQKVLNNQIVLLVLFFCFSAIFGQEKHRFQEEVNAILIKYDALQESTKKTIVFTGSSSIRLWNELPHLFPEHQIINTGFGASLSTDLLHFHKELILNFAPDQVFIYEGDNDISSNRKPNEIISTTKEIIERINLSNPKTEIVLISAKPSVNRWKLKNKYIRFNRKLKRLGKRNDRIKFVDVWNPMLNGKNINTSLFMEDGLHMNENGYAIWHTEIKPLIIK